MSRDGNRFAPLFGTPGCMKKCLQDSHLLRYAQFIIIKEFLDDYDIMHFNALLTKLDNRNMNRLNNWAERSIRNTNRGLDGKDQQ